MSQRSRKSRARDVTRAIRANALSRGKEISPSYSETSSSFREEAYKSTGFYPTRFKARSEEGVSSGRVNVAGNVAERAEKLVNARNGAGSARARVSQGGQFRGTSSNARAPRSACSRFAGRISRREETRRLDVDRHVAREKQRDEKDRSSLRRSGFSVDKCLSSVLGERSRQIRRHFRLFPDNAAHRFGPRSENSPSSFISSAERVFSRTRKQAACEGEIPLK